MELTAEKAQFAVDCIRLDLATHDENAVWEPYQIAFLNNEDRFGHDNKCRQLGWSWTAACDGLCDSMLVEKTPHVFVSINLDEAKEKIRYALDIHEAVRPDVRIPIKRQSLTEIELKNGSRLISHPCRPVRGIARTRIYLDEIAHYGRGLDREIYRGSLPATTRGDGYLRMGSSPAGASGLFWEIGTEALRKYPGFSGHRRTTPWWHVNMFCKDVMKAARLAPYMATEERVYEFGHGPIIDLFENMFLEDFQQEQECNWSDEQTAWISWETIKKNQVPDLESWHVKSTSGLIDALNDMRHAVGTGKIERFFYGGVDIGRLHDRTEFIAVGRGIYGQFPLRLRLELDNVEYEDQLEAIWTIIHQLPFLCVLVDSSGIGSMLAEMLERSGRAVGVPMSSQMKERYAVAARVTMENGKAPIPPDRDLAYQIHSIKRSRTTMGAQRYDAERNERGHADAFWAWALSIFAAQTVQDLQMGREQVIDLSIPIGY